MEPSLSLNATTYKLEAMYGVAIMGQSMVTDITMDIRRILKIKKSMNC